MLPPSLLLPFCTLLTLPFHPCLCHFPCLPHLFPTLCSSFLSSFFSVLAFFSFHANPLRFHPCLHCAPFLPQSFLTYFLLLFHYLSFFVLASFFIPFLPLLSILAYVVLPTFSLCLLLALFSLVSISLFIILTLISIPYPYCFALIFPDTGLLIFSPAFPSSAGVHGK